MLLCAEKFVEDLESKNLNFEQRDTEHGDTLVEFPYEGKVAKCFFSGDDGQYFSIYQIFERIPEEKLADLIFLCNELNSEYKWVTYYVDKDNDLVLHVDAILSPESAADECFELLVRMLKNASKTKPQIMKAIYA